MTSWWTRYSLSAISRIALYSLALFIVSLFRLPLSWLRIRRLRQRSVAGSPTRIFLYSQVVWQEVWQRPQEMSLGLSEQLPVTFVSPVQIHRLFDSVLDWRAHLRRETIHGVDIHQPLILPGEYKSRPIRWFNRQLVAAETARILSQGEGPAIFITNSPFSGSLLERFDWAYRVYDLIDDFVKCDWAPPGSELLELEQIERCDLLLTGTQQLAETKGDLHQRIRFVPPGVDFELFQQSPPEPADLAAIPRPRAGYTGSLSERLDPEIIAQLAAQRPELQIVLIGPVHGDFSPRPEAPNIHYLGPRAHEELPSYLARFDLALIPFRLNEMTRSLNPIKTLEYLAAGRVVIASALPDIERFYGEVVELAQTPDEFVEKACKWLDSDRTEREALGRETARGHSWQAMSEQMWREIENGMREMKQA
jgi:UDP-galactopyranose mutase